MPKRSRRADYAAPDPRTFRSSRTRVACLPKTLYVPVDPGTKWAYLSTASCLRRPAGSERVPRRLPSTESVQVGASAQRPAKPAVRLHPGHGHVAPPPSNGFFGLSTSHRSTYQTQRGTDDSSCSWRTRPVHQLTRWRWRTAIRLYQRGVKLACLCVDCVEIPLVHPLRSKVAYGQRSQENPAPRNQPCGFAPRSLE